MISHQTQVKLPSVYMVNARSWNNKSDEFCCLVYDYDSDIVTVSETWIQQNVPENVYFIKHYSLLTMSRNNSRGGGIALYAKFSMNASSDYHPSA